MPNWATNFLKVTGKSADRFKDIVYKEDASAADRFLMDRTVPMPAELSGTNSPPQTDEEKKLQAELKKKYGSGNWYDWCAKNWGTKWDIGECCLNETAGGWLFSFDTAWSPPIEWIIQTARQFPDLTFEDTWAAEGGEGYGRFTVWTEDDELQISNVPIPAHEWYMQFEDYVIMYNEITAGDYDKVIDTFITNASDYEDTEYIIYLEQFLLDRIKDNDLPLLASYDFKNDEVQEAYLKRLKGE